MKFRKVKFGKIWNSLNLWFSVFIWQFAMANFAKICHKKTGRSNLPVKFGKI